MLARIKVWAVSTNWFWKVRAWLSTQEFRFERIGHESISGISTPIQKLKIGRELAWIGAKKFTFVALTLLTLEYVEGRVVEALSLPSWPTAIVQADYTSQLEFYALLLTAIFSIYFATIAIILSTGYAKLNRNIISLLISEQVGNLYTSTLIFATAFCLTATAINLVGYQTGLATYVLASFLTVVSVLTLFSMGQRLFEFFELTPLIEGEILPKIAQHIESVAKGRNSISYQNHFSRLARNRLAQLDFINMRLQSEEDKLEQNLPLLTKIYSGLLVYYLHRKHKIPKESYWYPRFQFHPDWFLAGDSATSMALNTNSQIMPEERPDLDWFEREMLEKIHCHLEIALRSGKWKLALRQLVDMSPRTMIYAQSQYFNTGLEDINKTRKLLEQYLSNLNTGTETDVKNAVALADAWVSIARNFFIETLRRIHTFEKELVEFFQEDDWSFSASQNLPAFLQVEIRYLQEMVAFERKVEKRRLSRPKYLQQLAIKPLLVHYSEILRTVSEFECEEIPSFVRKLLELGHPAAATHVVLSSLHANWKLPGWFSELETRFERYAAYQTYEEEVYRLPSPDFKSLQGKFESQRGELMALLSSQNLSAHLFASRSHDTSLPDHFGQTYYILADECLNSLIRNDEQTMERVFQTFFSLAFMASNLKFTDPSLKVNDEFRLHLISTANKDMATLLGYSILLAEHHGNNKLRTVPMAIWERLLENAKDRKSYLERTLMISDSSWFSISASPRSLIRTEWKIKFETKLREDGYDDGLFSYRGSPHPSHIVDVFRGGYYDASDVFFALHVVDEINLDDDKIKRQIRDYSSQLSRRTGAEE